MVLFSVSSEWLHVQISTKVSESEPLFTVFLCWPSLSHVLSLLVLSLCHCRDRALPSGSFVTAGVGGHLKCCYQIVNQNH